jgi:hypothetical protein
VEESKSKSMFRHEPIESSDGKPTYNIFKGNQLIAEVRGTNPASQSIIPMRELNEYEESKLHEYIGNLKGQVE